MIMRIKSLSLFNRPFDNQTDFKILLESEAKLKIQEHIRFGLYELVWSYILDYENSKNPFRERREQIGKWKKYANVDIEAQDSVIQLSKSLNQLGLKNFDALHMCPNTMSNVCTAVLATSRHWPSLTARMWLFLPSVRRS
jgi:hypothetical protein